MSTSNSPLWKLQKEAKKMAHHLKSPGVLPQKSVIKFGIAMDDKFITIDMERSKIVGASEEALEAMIVREMRGHVVN